MDNKKFVSIAIVSIIIVLAGLVAYFTLFKTVPSPVVDSSESDALANKPLKHHGPLLLEAWFEGYDRLYYEFDYPESDFSVTTAPDNKKITIKEITTGKTSLVSVSYEGGRGYTPQDYWNETLKPTCANCVPITNTVSVKDAQGLVTFANQDKEWVIFSGPPTSGWLFVAELQKPASNVEKILSSFVFKSATSGDMTSGVPFKDETANWKTYRNEQYGFEVKYPKEWVIIDAQSSIRLNSLENQKVLEQADIETNAGRRLEGAPDNISIIVDNKSVSSQTLEQYVQKKKNGGFENPTKMFISGTLAFKGFLDGLYAGDSILFEHGEYLFNIVVTSESMGMNQELTNKILSTIKFIK